MRGEFAINYKYVIDEKEDNIARVTLSRPEKLKERRDRGAKVGFHERDKCYAGLV